MFSREEGKYLKYVGRKLILHLWITVSGFFCKQISNTNKYNNTINLMFQYFTCSSQFLNNH